MADQPLDDALRAHLNNWRNDVSAEWQAVLAGVEPAFSEVREDLLLHDGETIYPGRKGHALPGAAEDAHVFRALDRVAPRAVKAVVVGQDPYTHINQATGRAFDQGDLKGWTGPGNTVTTSLRRLLQITAFQRTQDPAYLVGGTGWQTAAANVANGSLVIESPRALFDRWEDNGVLFLNAGLTISRYVPGGGDEQAYGHIPCWRPIIHRILTALVRRTEGRVVFLTWGAFARRVVQDSGVKALPGWGTRATTAEYAHPATAAFLTPPNPFAKANEALVALGGTPVAW